MENFSKIPDIYLSLLYSHRLYEDRWAKYEDYIKRYTLIEIDGILYGTSDEEDRAKAWARGGNFSMTVPDAVIRGGAIIKNRYGNLNGAKVEECNDLRRAGLSDLLKEKWLRERNDGDIVWVTKEGRIIPIKNLSHDHLENIINHLREKEEFEGVAEVYDAHISSSDLG